MKGMLASINVDEKTKENLIGFFNVGPKTNYSNPNPSHWEHMIRIVRRNVIFFLFEQIN